MVCAVGISACSCYPNGLVLHSRNRVIHFLYEEFRCQFCCLLCNRHDCTLQVVIYVVCYVACKTNTFITLFLKQRKCSYWLDLLTLLFPEVDIVRLNLFRQLHHMNCNLILHEQDTQKWLTTWQFQWEKYEKYEITISCPSFFFLRCFF